VKASWRLIDRTNRSYFVAILFECFCQPRTFISQPASQPESECSARRDAKAALTLHPYAFFFACSTSKYNVIHAKNNSCARFRGCELAVCRSWFADFRLEAWWICPTSSCDACPRPSVDAVGRLCETWLALGQLIFELLHLFGPSFFYVQLANSRVVRAAGWPLRKWPASSADSRQAEVHVVCIAFWSSSKLLQVASADDLLVAIPVVGSFPR